MWNQSPAELEAWYRRDAADFAQALEAAGDHLLPGKRRNAIHQIASAKTPKNGGQAHHQVDG